VVFVCTAVLNILAYVVLLMMITNLIVVIVVGCIIGIAV
jgi:hypothetical protein